MNNKNAVLQGLENMRQYDECGDKIQYSFKGCDYTVDEMIKEIANDTEVGISFSQDIYDMVILYMGKFSQDAD